MAPGNVIFATESNTCIYIFVPDQLSCIYMQVSDAHEKLIDLQKALDETTDLKQ